MANEYSRFKQLEYLVFIFRHISAVYGHYNTRNSVIPKCSNLAPGGGGGGGGNATFACKQPIRQEEEAAAGAQQQKRG